MSGPDARALTDAFTGGAVEKCGAAFADPRKTLQRKSGGRFHFHFGIEIGNDVLECLDRLLDRCDLHQLPVLDRPIAILQRDDQIPPLLLKLNKR